MINKKSVWFLTLFSLILVLSVYYVTMPSELLLSTNSDYTELVNAEIDDDSLETEEVNVDIQESDILTAMRVEANDKYTEELNVLTEILTNNDATTEDKNNAYEKMKIINNKRGMEEKLEKLITENYEMKSVVLIDGNNISVTINSSEHNTTVANNIMRLIQEQYETKMYITVKFQK